MNNKSRVTSDKYDVIVVLGAAVKRGGEPGPALRRRVFHAISLFQQGISSYLLMTGGVGKHPPAEAVVMKDIAVKKGIPEERILLEDKSCTTLQSVFNCREILCTHKWLSAVIVTDPYHILRTVMAFRLVGIEASGSAAIGGKEENPKWKWIYFHLREIVALPWSILLIVFKLIFKPKE